MSENRSCDIGSTCAFLGWSSAAQSRVTINPAPTRAKLRIAIPPQRRCLDYMLNRVGISCAKRKLVPMGKFQAILLFRQADLAAQRRQPRIAAEQRKSWSHEN